MRRKQLLFGTTPPPHIRSAPPLASRGGKRQTDVHGEIAGLHGPPRTSVPTMYRRLFGGKRGAFRVEAPTPIGRWGFCVIFMNSSHSSAVSRAREDECTYGEELCAVREEGTYGKRRHCGRYIRHGDEDVLLCLRKKPPHGFHGENRGANTSNLR